MMSGPDIDADRADDDSARTSVSDSPAGPDSPDGTDPGHDEATEDDVADGQLETGLPFERPPIEPEDPTAENALFVVLGVLGTVGLLATAIVPGAL
jgi:hypothetical protein